MVFVGVLAFVPAKETTCRDGWHSPSIGRAGACSHHGGVDRSWGLRTWLLILGLPAGWWVGAQIPKGLESIHEKGKAKDRQRTIDQYDAQLKEQKRSIEARLQNRELMDRAECPKCSMPLSIGILHRGRDAGEVTLRCSDWMKCDFKKVLLPGRDFVGSIEGTSTDLAP